MKDWDYYSGNDHEYPDRSAYRAKLKQEINDTPMTAEQRNKALNQLQRKVAEWFTEASQPYEECRMARLNEFWKDCREELGYDEYLEPAGIAALEEAAYERGHGHGFYDIFHALEELDDLARVLVKNLKQPVTELEDKS